VFHYYSLRGDTAMPGGLYAGLCYDAFLVLLYLRDPDYVNFLAERTFRPLLVAMKDIYSSQSLNTSLPWQVAGGGAKH